MNVAFMANHTQVAYVMSRGLRSNNTALIRHRPAQQVCDNVLHKSNAVVGRGWAGGQDRTWCRGTRTYPMNTLRNGLIAEVIRFLPQSISKEKGLLPNSLIEWRARRDKSGHWNIQFEL